MDLLAAFIAFLSAPEHAFVVLGGGVFLFCLGLIVLLTTHHSSRRQVKARDTSGVFIAGDGNTNISATVSNPPAAVTPQPAWKRLTQVLAWLAALAGPVIAALAYWLPRGGP